MIVEIFDRPRAEANIEGLAQILAEAVEDGALVGYVLPFDKAMARTYWHGMLASIDCGERVLFCVLADDRIVGTVQLYLSPEPNAPHRGEVYKLLVGRDFQRRGIGAALMQAVEGEARRYGRTLLLLDTAEGGAGERLYRRTGWREIGAVPNHFVDPHGRPKTSIYFMRVLD